MKLKILPSAAADLVQGAGFYERQAEGLGAYFLDTLFSDVESLVLYAGIHRKINGYYRLLSRRFPYAVYYTIDEDQVRVWRILDCRRDPQKIRTALSGRDG